MSVASGPGGFDSASTTAATVSGGVASFNNLVLDIAGGYTLQASGAGLTLASAGFTVVPAAASQFLLNSKPTTATAGQAFSPAVGVALTDQFNNLLTTDNSDQVTLALLAGPGGFIAGSTTTLTLTAGTATFSGVGMATAGVYTLRAKGPGALQSQSFVVHVARAGGPPSWLPAVSELLTHSAEYYAGVVALAYQRYLGRPPSPSETAGWVSAMQAGLSDEHLEAGFIGSAEYIANHGGAGAGWVTGMYKDLLGRTPSQHEVDLWVAALNGGEPPTQVAYGFAASAEREGQHVTADYNTFLGRPPSAQEVSAWVDAFVHQGVSNEDVIAGFAGSAEYFQRQGNKPSDWMYQVLLGLFGPPGF
jgi:hypothetical protein